MTYRRLRRSRLPLLGLLLALVSAPLAAQPLPDAACTTLKALGAKFGALNTGTDDQRRQFALVVAQQFTFSFPGQGWGSKSAGAGRPQTKDVVARQAGGTLEGWDLVDGNTRQVICTSHVDLPGQLFIAVAAVDHLGGVTLPPPPPPPPPPAGGITKADLDAAIADLHSEIGREVATDLAILRTRLETLEAGGGGGGGSVPSTDVARQQLAVLKEILALLKAAAQ